MSFGLNATATVQPIVEYSTDATNWTEITYTSVAGWQLITTASAAIPSSATLSLRFTQPVVAGQLRIDDVRVFNFDPSCTLTLEIQLLHVMLLL